jgi:hypothetical protein
MLFPIAKHFESLPSVFLLIVIRFLIFLQIPVFNILPLPLSMFVSPESQAQAQADTHAAIYPIPCLVRQGVKSAIVNH